MTGASEKVLKRSKRSYRKAYIHPTHHAGYYPGAVAMTLKLLFDPETGKVLGAQVVGGKRSRIRDFDVDHVRAAVHGQ